MGSKGKNHHIKRIHKSQAHNRLMCEWYVSLAKELSTLWKEIRSRSHEANERQKKTFRNPLTSSTTDCPKTNSYVKLIYLNSEHIPKQKEGTV